MERKYVRNGNKFEQMEEKNKFSTGLAEELWEYAHNGYNRERLSRIWKHLEKSYGKSPLDVETCEEFWHKDLEKAMVALTDKQFLEDMKGMVKMCSEGQFSGSMWRRSYRSADFGYYVSRVLEALTGCIRLESYDESTEELLYCQHEWLKSYEFRLAYEIRKGNKAIISAIKDAILGENQNLILTAKIVQACVISGNEELRELLVKLLLAAKLQEGVRQQILENADSGPVQTLIRFLQVCLEEDMFRFSSVIRAFGTWTGLGYSDEKPAVVKKAAQIALDCLQDEKLRKEYLESENNQEAYLALWATGCYEVTDTDRMVRKLLDDNRKYRKILGWLFISHTDNTGYRMKLAASYLGERDEEILAWVVNNLTYTGGLFGTYVRTKSGEPITNSNLPSGISERRKLFYELKEVVDYIGNKSKTFTGNPFEFTAITLQAEPVLRCMMSIAGYDMSEEAIEVVADYLPMMDVTLRESFYHNFLRADKNLKHREYLRTALSDRSVQVKELAVKRLSECNLLTEDLEVLAQSLRSKSSSLRKAVLSVFHKQKNEILLPVIEKMLKSTEEYQNQAAIELLLDMKNEQPEILKAQKETLNQLGERKLSTQTRILLDQLCPEGKKEETVYSQENGFGLFDPQVIETTVMTGEGEDPQEPKKGLLQRIFSKKEESPWNAGKLRALYPTEAEYDKLLLKMNDVFERHGDFEYETENWDGSREKVLFGDKRGTILIPAEYGRVLRGNEKLSMIPFYQEFLEVLSEYTADVYKMLGLYLSTDRYNGDRMWNDETYDSWFLPIVQKGISVSHLQFGYGKYDQRHWQMIVFIGMLPQKFEKHTLFEAALSLYQGFIDVIGEENLDKNFVKKKQQSVAYYGDRNRYVINYRPLVILRKLLSEAAEEKEDFEKWFCFEYRLERQYKVSVYSSLSMKDYFRACDEKIVPKDVLYEQLLTGSAAAGNIRMLTGAVRFKEGKEILEKYDWAKETVETVVNRIVEVEGKRGELGTPLTVVAQAIQRFEGAAHFCKLLSALGKENFYSGYAYNSGNTKRSVLSQLLKRCYPAKEDTADSLKGLLKQTDISDKRLAEAVMYAPQWAGFTEEILGWQGLKSSVWFFHAHINETFSAEKETEVAVYSPISPQQFNDGAFDKDWFFTAYGELGEKRFQILYKSAKYITSGNSQHRRSQLYTDAVLGKLDAEELKKEIEEKRNQEKLRCYPLIPLDENRPNEALYRYEFIQKFLKESKQFGAQRRESERKACATAMENLAITTGFMDVNRMTWYLESEKFKELAPMLEPRQFEDVSVWLEIEKDGTPELAISKNGKRQKTLPKNLAKHEWILTLKESIKDLKEQKRRAGISLERAMTEGTEFGVTELERLCKNPVLSPSVLSLVWTDGEVLGFLKYEGEKVSLLNLNGENKALAIEHLRIAHPHDLRVAGVWSDYMHYLYENKITQPFKQVFREYYPLTEEERQERTISRRYAGHQVQPRKTVALLRDKGWTVDYEEGLQKVFYKENLIVRMYALADWFSPADIEAPTLEEIRFFDRKTNRPVDLNEIPPVVFSETMRDMDLVVSVAHVGGVDPEASHSTVEMRTAIAQELAGLLKLSNVEFVGSHAKIYGSLSSYSVHLGSGVVHAKGKGMIAVLPVHSQARGRIFLPFADDDPKTAEIMSKILLFAEDKKIKDASILQQL